MTAKNVVLEVAYNKLLEKYEEKDGAFQALKEKYEVALRSGFPGRELKHGKSEKGKVVECGETDCDELQAIACEGEYFSVEYYLHQKTISLTVCCLPSFLSQLVLVRVQRAKDQIAELNTFSTHFCRFLDLMNYADFQVL